MKNLKSLFKLFIYKTIGPKIFYRTVNLPDGLKMKVDITDKLGSKWIYKKEAPDAFELKLVKKLVHSGDVCIDVGANIGLYTLTMSCSTGETGKVFAFEPSFKTFEILSNNVALNSLRNIVLCRQGISDKVGKSEFFVTIQSGLAGLGNTGRGTVVKKEFIETTTIDEYAKQNNISKIDFLKIDVEGFEGRVLQGAENLLKSQNDLIIMVELDVKNFAAFGFSVTETISFLNNLGYRGWVIDRSGMSLAPIDNKDPIGVNFLFAKPNNTRISEVL